MQMMQRANERRVFGCGNETVRQTAKIGSLVDVQDSEDPEGLRVMYYLVQDLKVSYDIPRSQEIG